MTDRELVHKAFGMLKQAKDSVADWGAYASEYFQHKHNLQGSIDDIQAQITVLSERLAQPEQDWDWRHPKAQALIGAKARLEIKLRLVEQLVEDPNFETTASDMEYWEPLHDKLQGRLAQPGQEPFCFHDGRNIVGKEYADHSDVFPLYTSPNPEQQKPVRFNCTVIDDAHLNGVPLSQWGKQHEMQPCAGRNCGSTNPNLHSAECFEDYEKTTGMNQRKPLPPQSPCEMTQAEGKMFRLGWLECEAAHGIKGDTNAN